LVHYLGSYDYCYSRWLCWLANLFTAILGSLDKFVQLGERFGFVR
jgi:hypothetical protein